MVRCHKHCRFVRCRLFGNDEIFFFQFWNFLKKNLVTNINILTSNRRIGISLLQNIYSILFGYIIISELVQYIAFGRALKLRRRGKKCKSGSCELIIIFHGAVRDSQLGNDSGLFFHGENEAKCDFSPFSTNTTQPPWFPSS